MKDVYEAIDRGQEKFIAELNDLLRLPSVSYTGEGISECAAHLCRWLQGWGAEARVVPTKGHPVVLGKVEPPGARRRVIVYGHYDVKQVGDLSEWESPPFEPTERGGAIYARGAADDKGQLLANAIAVRLLKEMGRLPVAVIFVFEGEEEIGCKSFQGFAEAHREELRADLYYASDGPRHTSGRPTVRLGNRGNLCMRLVVRNEIGKHVHSGNFGELVRNPAWDLVHILHTMKDPEGEVLIPGFYDEVAPPSELERQALADIPDDEAEVCRALGISKIYGSPRYSVSEKLFFRPTLTIEGFECGMESTIIPGQAMCYLESRLVKNMTPEGTFEKIKRHVEAQGIPGATLSLTRGSLPNKTPLDHPMVRPVLEAFRRMHREGVLDASPLVMPISGGSNASTQVFNQYLGLPVITTNYSQPNSGQHGPNESIRIDHFMMGIKMGAAALASLAG
ncbi:MAG: M20/M25/M40 family metallo-hydrolase [Candidatus Tectomicrobia bacterium]|uniref:M20/M25/M40 family metallo-hydrolase n=1 Tax=Tectimicrobiota bacterium TaxID=2528274 RepID=A0A932HWG3_UNCTE|nr:M20/M25/M40 family metallo-hydrolase [Candidatus Tectomicrobia bacterium]